MNNPEERHKNCAKTFGTFEGQVPIPIKRRVEFIDPCIAHIVAALNAGGILTLASCCGHGKIDGNIILDGERVLIIKEYKEGMFVNKQYTDITYEKMTNLYKGEFVFPLAVKEDREAHGIYDINNKYFVGGLSLFGATTICNAINAYDKTEKDRLELESVTKQLKIAKKTLEEIEIAAIGIKYKTINEVVLKSLSDMKEVNDTMRNKQ